MSRKRYISSLEETIELLFEILKYKYEMPIADKYRCEGYIQTGGDVDIVDNEKLEEVVERINQKIFGISVRERVKLYRNIKLSKERYLDIPTIIRKKVKLKNKFNL